jgi:hypothetical protein
MKNYYLKLSRERFKTITILFMAFGDILLCRWLWMRFIENPKVEMFINIAMKNLNASGQFDKSLMPPDYAEQILALMKKSLLIMFAFIIVIHALNYWAYWSHKVVAFYYLRVIAWTGAFGAFSVGISSLELGLLGYLILLLSFMYLFCALGFIYHSPKAEQIN